MADLINSIKAFGEKVTGEKIEGTTLIDSMKDMGKKMTGKEIEGNSLLAIIDETTEGYEGGDGGASMVELPSGCTLALDGTKLLQLLVAKDVDVDAEVDFADGYSPYTGILLGCVVELGEYLHLSVVPHMLYAYASSEDTYVKWSIDNSNGMHTETQVETPNALTFKTMLEHLGTVNIHIWRSGISLVPYVALKTSSQSMSQPVNITTDEFLSFITIIPANEQTEE